MPNYTNHSDFVLINLLTDRTTGEIIGSSIIRMSCDAETALNACALYEGMYCRPTRPGETGLIYGLAVPYKELFVAK